MSETGKTPKQADQVGQGPVSWTGLIRQRDPAWLEQAWPDFVEWQRLVRPAILEGQKNYYLGLLIDYCFHRESNQRPYQKGLT